MRVQDIEHIYAYKNLAGFQQLKDGDEKHTADYVIMTKSQYEEIIQELRDRQRRYENEKEDKEKQVKKINDAAVAYKKKADQDAQAVVEAANTKVEQAEAEAQRQTNLNNNLLRITKERANAKRGLQPKKSHSGYRFAGKIMQTKTICGHEKNEGAIYTDVWTATLETPYDATIPIHQIKDRIFEDLRGEDGILEKLYIKSWIFKESGELWKGTYSDVIENAKKFDMEGQNILFDYKLMANPKTRLWEIQITTTKSIRALSEMMAPGKNPKNGKNSVSNVEPVEILNSDFL